MKFKFSLDPVLRVRKHHKKIKKQKLAEQLSEKQRIEQLQQQVKDKLQSYIDQTENNEIQNVQTIRRRAAHMEQAHERMKKLSQDLSKADEKVSKARNDLAEAHKDLHMIEKMKESEHQVFKEEVSKEEQKFLDEIATQSYSR